MFSSCNSQNKIDLEKLDFHQSSKDLFTNLKFREDKRDIATTLPIEYTYEAQNFKYGPIEFLKSEKTDEAFNKVGVFLDSIKNIKGIFIDIESSKQSIPLLNYITKTYGTAHVLSKVPDKDRNGIQSGISAYTWNIPNEHRFINLIQFYKEVNSKNTIATYFYLIDDTIKTTNPDDNRTVKELLIQASTF